MLNPIECFIEAIQSNHQSNDLIQEVQQFLEFQQGSILQQSQKRIMNDPIILLNNSYQLEEYLVKQKQSKTTKQNNDLSSKALTIIQVQLVLLTKFIQLNQNELNEYYYLFEILQKKMKLLRIYSNNDDILSQCLDASRILVNKVDQCKLSALSQLLYHINVYEFEDDEENLLQFYDKIMAVKDKKQKILENHSNLVVYALNLLLQKCQRLVGCQDKLNIVLQITQLIKQDGPKTIGFNNQLNLCILMVYYKLNMINEFISYSKQIDMKGLSIEIQILSLIINCKQLINEVDLEQQFQDHYKLLTNFMELNIIHQVTDILLIIKELTLNLDTYILGIRTILIWLQFKFNQIQKSSNPQNISKTINDINYIFEQGPFLLNLQFEQSQLELILNIIISQLLELIELIIQIIGNLKSIGKFNINNFIAFILKILPQFTNYHDRNIQKQAGQLISTLSTIQIDISPQIQGLAIYLNIQFGHLPQSQSILFQQIIKNYKEGFTTAVLLFIKEMNTQKTSENRQYLSKQLRSLLNECYSKFQQNPIPLYTLMECCLNNEDNYYIPIILNFLKDNQHLTQNQQIFQFSLQYLIKSQVIDLSFEEINLDSIFYEIYIQLSTHNNKLDYTIIQQIYNISIQKPKSFYKSLCILFSYFLIQMKLTSTSLQFIKDTITSSNQVKYQWKSENDKSIYIFLIDICEQYNKQFELNQLKLLIDMILYIIENTNREEVTLTIPYVLRMIVKLILPIKLDDHLIKIMNYSIRIPNLFSLLISDLMINEEIRMKNILKKFIYENQLPTICYFQVLAQLIEISQTIEEVVELIPQLNQILRTQLLDETLIPYAQLIYLKLNNLHEYIPLHKIDMFTQSINLLQTKL